jgi:hypothetical protein
VTLLVSYLKDFGSHFNIIILLLVICLSLAGIITQIRVYSLIVTCWKRILKIQYRESIILKQLYTIHEELEKAMFFPRYMNNKRSIFYYLSVGMISCAIFVIILGIAIFAIMNYCHVPLWISIIVTITISLSLIILSFIFSERFIKSFEIPIDEKY